MADLPPLPRIDPDLQDSGQQPLATGHWLPSAATLNALSVDENDPEAINPIILGRLTDRQGRSQLIGFDDDRHIATVAGSRAGKGNSLIIPNLLSYKGSVICIDPKGENASVTAEYRRAVLGQEVYVLDPYRVSHVPEALRATFNPLEWLDPDDPEVIEDAAALADSIIISGNSKDPHWDESARTFIKGLILLILAHMEDPKNRIFDHLYDFATVGLDVPKGEPPTITNALLLMKSTEHFNGAIAAAGAALLEMGENERGSVLSTTRRNIEFLESPSIRANLQSSSFDPRSFKSAPKGVTLYIVLPEWRLGTHARWLRMIINSLLHALERTPKRSGDAPATLFILEEFASLGYMQSIERAAGYIAGFGVKLWSILQDLNQLKDIYPKRWETFLGNAGILTAFGNVDITTLEYLSKRAGETEITRILATQNYQSGKNETNQGMWQTVQGLLKSEDGLPGSFGPQSEGSSEGYSVSQAPQLHRTPVILPDEIARYFARERGALLALIAGLPPIRLSRIVTHLDPVFAKRAGQNPFHR